MSDFKVGDKVLTKLGAGTVVVKYGPYETRWGSGVYTLEMEDGKHFQESGSQLTPLPAFKVGDKVTTADTLFETELGSVVAGPFNGPRERWWVVRVGEEDIRMVESTMVKA